MDILGFFVKMTLMKKVQKLANLLNDYTNSESQYYYNLKKKLLKGIEISYTAPEVESFRDEMEAFDFINAISDEQIGVGYKYGQLDHNIKLYFFSDDKIEMTIKLKDKLIFSKVFKLSAYSSYSVTRTYPKIKHNKSNYIVSLKLVKQGQDRKNYEKDCVEDVEKYAKDQITQLHQTMQGWEKAEFAGHYPEMYHTLSQRMKLFGYECKSEDELKNVLKNLTPQDLGIKDIVKLTYVGDIFFKLNLSNNKMFEQLEKVIRTRKNYYEELCLQIK